MFDFDKDKKIETSEIGVVVRSVGLNPTEAELKEIICDVNGSQHFLIIFRFFCSLRFLISNMKYVILSDQIYIY